MTDSMTEFNLSECIKT